ncbi:DPEP2 neighbor protein [Erinaceus europaeus]|uniref:DPEP2 neighbor protein n=1 Tax=Erinaceus europaeus TaxID=9365 RepID=A0A1S2ZDR6_ERIEU|nr:DPEP2 neighbor protein [Erinaceus europaeus]
MTDIILYIISDLSSVPWKGSTAAAVPPTSRPTPGYYHILYKGWRETQVGWHGETYCLARGCRAFGDAPLPILAENPVVKYAHKRHLLSSTEDDFERGCPRPKKAKLQLQCRRLTRRKNIKPRRR